jgi:hypothetical protein
VARVVRRAVRRSSPRGGRVKAQRRRSAAAPGPSSCSKTLWKTVPVVRRPQGGSRRRPSSCSGRARRVAPAHPPMAPIPVGLARPTHPAVAAVRSPRRRGTARPRLRRRRWTDRDLRQRPARHSRAGDQQRARDINADGAASPAARVAARRLRRYSRAAPRRRHRSRLTCSGAWRRRHAQRGRRGAVAASVLVRRRWHPKPPSLRRPGAPTSASCVAPLSVPRAAGHPEIGV